jgi:hypothetical protein
MLGLISDTEKMESRHFVGTDSRTQLRTANSSEPSNPPKLARNFFVPSAAGFHSLGPHLRCLGSNVLFPHLNSERNEKIE